MPCTPVTSHLYTRSAAMDRRYRKPRYSICFRVPPIEDIRNQYSSPGSLQDATMEESQSFGCRSSYGAMPQYNQGNTSPVAQGRSVREYEEQMSAIRKENFNLRLRLYFLEEEMNSKRTDVKGRPIQGAGDAQENAVKQLINTKVEMEMLRKECQEKQELLRDAAQAMNKIEQRQKENEERSQMMIEELTERIQYLEAERNQKTRNDAKIVGEIIELTDATSDDASAKQKLYLLTQIRDLEANVAESKETIKKLETEILKLNQQSEQKQARLQEYEEKLVTLSFENDALKEKLQQQHEQAANSEEISRLQNELQQLKCELADKTCMLQDADEQLQERKKMHEKACLTIQRLSCVIKKNEMEQKVGRQSKSQSSNAHSTSSGSSIIDMATHEATIAELRQQLHEARESAEHAEKWHQVYAELCTELSHRLEGLSNFLNSLLATKDLLGFLAADRRRAMQKAVNRSLELSKNLSLKLSDSNAASVSVMEMSVLQLSNISDLLDELKLENSTFNSHEELLLQQQLLKKAHKRDGKDRRSLPAGPSAALHSESECWSEPDRQVSLARIGLEEHAMLHKAANDTDSDSEARKQSRADKNNKSGANNSRISERITELEELLQQRDERIKMLLSQLNDLQTHLNKELLKNGDLTREQQEECQRNEELKAEIMALKTVAALDQSSAGHDRSELMRQVEQHTQALEQKIEAAQQQVLQLQRERAQQENKHSAELELLQQSEQQKLKELRAELLQHMQQRLEEQQREELEERERAWVQRELYEELQQNLKQLQTQLQEAQQEIEYLNENEEELKKNMLENEKNMRTLKKQLDETMLQASRTVQERTKALNENLQLQRRLDEHKQEMQQKLEEFNELRDGKQQLQDILNALRQENEILQEEVAANKRNVRLNSSLDGASQSGYTSEDVPMQGALQSGGEVSSSGQSNTPRQKYKVEVKRLNSSSPDLGIESDAGRASSVKDSKTSVEKKEDVTDVNGNGRPHDCLKLEQENAELRQRLERYKIIFAQTYQKLHLANQRKEQVEKDIKSQILKTNNVLQHVRSNIENAKKK